MPNSRVEVTIPQVLEGSHVLDLTEQELGAGAVGIGIEAPEVRKAAFGEFSLADADDDSKAALSGDTDGDGMPDWYEVAMGHDIENADADII